MKLYLLRQSINTGYDTYDSAVVCAKNEDEARMIRPGKDNWDGASDEYGGWRAAAEVEVKFIGVAIDGLEKGVICPSYNTA